MPKSSVDETPESTPPGRSKLERIKHQPLPTALPPRKRVKAKKQRWKSPLPVGYGVIGATVLVVAIVLIGLWSAGSPSPSKFGAVAHRSVNDELPSPSGQLQPAQAGSPVETATTPPPVAPEKTAVGARQGPASIGRRPKEKVSDNSFDGGPKKGTSIEQYFRKLDANGDHRLDASELPRYIIRRADTNRDDELTLNELEQAFKKRGPQLFGPPASAETLPSPSGGPGSGNPSAHNGL
ncbi:MAG TPA: hypothetical protein VGP63_10515 [Planctomycetaceae bacterium]|nr:hypothetical protein [Planctomycetaceae bacterium]